MIELGVEPAVHRMTTGALGGKTESDVIEHRGLEVLLVARIASGGQADKLPGGRLLVALVAVHHGVRAHQREAVVVVFDGLQRDLPTLNRVALGAIGAELATVNVGVAGGALRAHVLEHHAGVALRAGHALVHAAQRIAGQIMIEIRLGTDRLPTVIGVAVRAWNGNGAVGIGHLGLGCDTGRDT